MTTEETAKIVMMLLSADPIYPAGNIDRFVDVWKIGLGDLPYSAVEEAVQCWIREATSDRRFPKPGDIRVLIARNSGLPSAEDAWHRVMTAVREYGARAEPRWSHKAIADAVAAIGWRTICLSEEIGVERAHFYRTYQVYRDRAVRELSPESLGVVEGRKQIANHS